MSRHHRSEARFLKRGERLRDFVFGYNDGSITTLAVLITLAAASLDNIIIVLGALASMFASSISLAISDYLSIKSQIDVYKNIAANKRLPKKERTDMGDIVSDFDKPMKIVSMTWASFVAAGFIALAPFMFTGGFEALAVSISITLVGIFLAGMMRAKYTHGNKLRSGLEMGR
jgi:predicted membrane protein (TIGR00267 family)